MTRECPVRFCEGLWVKLPRSTLFRGLVTALHRSVAGLPRSKVGDHPVRCPHSPPEGSPHRVLGIALSIRCVLRLRHEDVSSDRCGVYSQAEIVTCWPMLQRKPASSRATATQILL